MSKHKRYHDIKTPLQMLRHSRQNAIGPLYHWTPKKKKPAPDAAASAQSGGKECNANGCSIFGKSHSSHYS